MTGPTTDPPTADPGSPQHLRSEIAALLSATADMVERLPGQRHEATSRDGAATATVTGDRRIVSITLRPGAKQELDQVALGEAVREAVTAAQRRATAAITAAVAHCTINGRTLTDLYTDPRFGSESS